MMAHFVWTSSRMQGHPVTMFIQFKLQSRSVFFPKRYPSGQSHSNHHQQHLRAQWWVNEFLQSPHWPKSCQPCKSFWLLAGFSMALHKPCYMLVYPTMVLCTKARRRARKSTEMRLDSIVYHLQHWHQIPLSCVVSSSRPLKWRTIIGLLGLLIKFLSLQINGK